MDRSYDMAIKIYINSAEIVVEQQEDGVLSRKTVTPESLFHSIIGSRYDDGIHPVGFLPEHCFSATLAGENTVYFIRYPELHTDFSYYGTEYRDFPLPRLVFSISYQRQVGKVGDVRMAVVADEKLTEETTLYRYPFSNVHSDNRICMGNNALPVYKDPARLHTLPGLILRFPNNNDMFSEEKNRLGLGYRDLLEHLKDKPPAYYYSDVLIPSGQKLKDFMRR